MCFLYALKILKRHGGRLLFLFHPNFHVLVCAKGRIFHGTNRGGKGWRIEELDPQAFAHYLGFNIPRRPELEDRGD
jgi:hypothetical protein